MMKALQEVVGKAGGNMSEASRQAILALIDDDSSDQTGKSINTIQSSWGLLTHRQIPLLLPTPVSLLRL